MKTFAKRYHTLWLVLAKAENQNYPHPRAKATGQGIYLILFLFFTIRSPAIFVQSLLYPDS